MYATIAKFSMKSTQMIWLFFFLLLEEFFQDGARIEAAFRHFFHRASPDQKEDSTEVIVCHANVIRYFVCR